MGDKRPPPGCFLARDEVWGRSCGCCRVPPASVERGDVVGALGFLHNVPEMRPPAAEYFRTELF